MATRKRSRRHLSVICSECGREINWSSAEQCSLCGTTLCKSCWTRSGRCTPCDRSFRDY